MVSGQAGATEGLGPSGRVGLRRFQAKLVLPVGISLRQTMHTFDFAWCRCQGNRFLAGEFRGYTWVTEVALFSA
jgi:hypothetical protein